MNKVNFLAKETFPQSTYTFDFMQNMILMSSKLSKLGGGTYILDGCEVKGNTVTDGLIVINGELMPFVGGNLKKFVAIQEVKETDHFMDIEYPEAYIHRKAVLSDTGTITWSSIKRVLTNQEIHEKFDSLKGDAPGTVKMWAGTVASIPEDYMLCDGRPLKNVDYPELSKNLNAIHGVEGTDAFKLPNLQGRFVVGQNSQHADYGQVGAIGGAEKVKLTEAELPRHRHAYSDDTNAQGRFPNVEPGFPQTIGGVSETKSSGSSSGTGTVYGSSHTGSDEAHENRPPYFVLCYIIKVK